MGCWTDVARGEPSVPARLLRRGDEGWHPDLERAGVRAIWAIGPLERGPAVAVVGTRRPTPYGREMAARIAGGLATRGIAVVSGMAAGIDACAHEAALRAGGRTIAVLGTGIDVAYPAGNRSLYERIRAEGTVLSEVPPGAAARREHFPHRNRIIAALGIATVFVQGLSGRSGAFGTATIASDLGRDVFAVPGDARAAMSSGPHALLREGWAHLCASADDVLAVVAPALGWDTTAGGIALPPDLPSSERAILDALATSGAGAEAIANAAGLDPLEAVRTLGDLEVKGFVRRTASGAYERAVP